MAAYQPVSGQGLGWDIPDFASTILRARQAQREEEQNRWAKLRDQGQMHQREHELASTDLQRAFENERLKTADQEAMVKHVTDLSSAGLGLAAEEIAGIHGFKAPHTQTPQQGASQQTQAEQPRSGVGQLFDNADLGDFAKKTLAAPGQTNQAQAESPMQGPPTSIPQGTPPIYQPSTPGQGTDPVAAATARLEAPSPQAAPPAQAPIQEQPQVQTFTGPNGHTFRVDPMEARRAELANNQRRADAIRQAFGQEPSMAPYVGTMASMAQGGMPVTSQEVVGMRNADAQARLKAQEDAAKLAEAQRSKADVETQSRWQRERNAAIMAGHPTMGGGPGNPDPKVFNAWETHKNHARNDEQVKSIATTNAMLDRIDAELATDNPLSQAMAIHSAAALSTSMGATGGRVTVQASRDVKEAYGALDSLENKAYRALNGGANMPSIVTKAKAAMQNLRTVNQSAGVNAYRQFHRTAGTGSEFAKDPTMFNHVLDEDVSLADQLGVDAIPPEQYGDNGETRQPAPAPSHGGHGKKGGKAPAKPPAQHNFGEDPLLKKYGY